jgi:hypothetical protein
LAAGKHADPVKNVTSLQDIVLLTNIGHHLLGVSFITGLKSNLCKAPKTQNTNENNCFILHAQNRTALRPIVLLTGIY